MTLTITVRGEGRATAQPDEVRLVLELTALEKAPHNALEDVTRRSAELESILDELGVPEGARTTSGITVQEEQEHDGTRLVLRGYRARGTMHVRLLDPSPIGRLVAEATSRADARVLGLWWHVFRDNPARVDAYRLAAADARRKADAYAEALGIVLGDVDTVIEPTSPPLQEARSGDLPVAAGELDVWSHVDVTFRIATEEEVT